MGSHRKMPRFRVAGNRGLLLSARDLLILAVCALGIAAACRLRPGRNGPSHP